MDRNVALSGVRAMAAMSSEDYAVRMTEMRTALARLREIHVTLLEEGVDYEKLDWADKPILKQSGAIQIIRFFGYGWSFVNREVEWDDGHITFVVLARLHLGGTHEGPIFGEWEASASTRESKYRYRNAKPKCPACGAMSIAKSQYPPKRDRDAEPGWWCRDCKADFYKDDPAITAQPVGKIENPDIADEESTIRHMAQKRALVGVVRIATGADRYFEHPDVAENAVIRERMQAEKARSVKAEVVEHAATDIKQERDDEYEDIRKAAAAGGQKKPPPAKKAEPAKRELTPEEEIAAIGSRVQDGLFKRENGEQQVGHATKATKDRLLALVQRLPQAKSGEWIAWLNNHPLEGDWKRAAVKIEEQLKAGAAK